MIPPSNPVHQRGFLKGREFDKRHGTNEFVFPFVFSHLSSFIFTQAPLNKSILPHASRYNLFLTILQRS